MSILKEKKMIKLNDLNTYPPIVCSFVDSNWRAASSVFLSKNTFCCKLRKCISCIINARFCVDSLREMRASTPRSGMKRHSPAPHDF